MAPESPCPRPALRGTLPLVVVNPSGGVLRHVLQPAGDPLNGYHMLAACHSAPAEFTADAEPLGDRPGANVRVRRIHRHVEVWACSRGPLDHPVHGKVDHLSAGVGARPVRLHVPGVLPLHLLEQPLQRPGPLLRVVRRARQGERGRPAADLGHVVGQDRPQPPDVTPRGPRGPTRDVAARSAAVVRLAAGTGEAARRAAGQNLHDSHKRPRGEDMKLRIKTVRSDLDRSRSADRLGGARGIGSPRAPV